MERRLYVVISNFWEIFCYFKIYIPKLLYFCILVFVKLIAKEVQLINLKNVIKIDSREKSVFFNPSGSPVLLILPLIISWTTSTLRIFLSYGVSILEKTRGFIVYLAKFGKRKGASVTNPCGMQVLHENTILNLENFPELSSFNFRENQRLCHVSGEMSQKKMYFNHKSLLHASAPLKYNFGDRFGWSVGVIRAGAILISHTVVGVIKSGERSIWYGAHVPDCRFGWISSLLTWIPNQGTSAMITSDQAERIQTDRRTSLKTPQDATLGTCMSSRRHAKVISQYLCAS